MTLFAAIAAFLLLPAIPAEAGSCGGDAHAHAGKGVAKDSIVDVAVKAGKFKTLVAAVKAAGLVDTLKSEGPFTVFAPTDEAFARLPEGTVEGLLADKEALTKVLTYHVIPGRLTAADVVGKSWIETVQGQSLRIQASGDAVSIDGARVVTTDIPAGNGVIHVIDAVLLPRKNLVETAVAAKNFETLVAAAKAAGLAGALAGDGPFTVFAPADSAFARLPEGTVESLLGQPEKLAEILKYHVISGRVLSTDLPKGQTQAKTLLGRKLEVARNADGSVTVNGAKVVTADVLAGNGVIHVIDSVIIPR
jgi:uncharacterized surface protein with fasciclin (FAS1) repeats